MFLALGSGWELSKVCFSCALWRNSRWGFALSAACFLDVSLASGKEMNAEYPCTFLFFVYLVINPWVLSIPRSRGWPRPGELTRLAGYGADFVRGRHNGRNLRPRDWFLFLAVIIEHPFAKWIRHFYSTFWLQCFLWAAAKYRVLEEAVMNFHLFFFCSTIAKQFV